jgi:hypothetical protein
VSIIVGLLVAIAAVLLVIDPILRPGARVWLPAPLDDADDDPTAARKELALAALKEIEFDRATGKLSDADYEKMLARYTKEAVEALREAEAPGGNAPVPVAAGATAVAPAAGVADDAIERLIADARQAGRGRKYCTSCGALLEASGRFCVECGARI